MMWLAVLAFAAFGYAQSAPAQTSPAPTEQEELSRALSEAGSSGTDLTRALERHLQKYPATPQRHAIEKALAQWAIESNDRRRTILYGERVLTAEPNNELQLIDHVIRALLDSGDPGAAKKALVYVKRYETQVEAMRSRAAEGHMSSGQWTEQVDNNLSRALVLEARAQELLGNVEDALGIAMKAWTNTPSGESAREAAGCLVKLGRREEAVEYYADAFALQDTSAANDRAQAGEIYTALHGSEKGLGDVFLSAYDRTRTLQRERAARIKKDDPNFDAVEIADFTLPRSDGGPGLAVASLKGKTVVLDFWATWCGPCRAQHPLIEEVKKKFPKGDVVFLSINSDDDHSLVADFLKDNHWDSTVYYDGGLEHALKVASIPTTIVLDREGRLASRMTGFIPELFEDMLKQRIEEARGETRGN